MYVSVSMWVWVVLFMCIHVYTCVCVCLYVCINFVLCFASIKYVTMKIYQIVMPCCKAHKYNALISDCFINMIT